MSNSAITTVTVWSEDPAALSAVEARAAAPAPARGTGRLGRLRWPGPRHPLEPHPFSLEALVPSRMRHDAWDADRALALWGCSRPEVSSTLELRAPDRLVYEVVTAHAPPDAALRALSADHPDVVVHAVTTCESEYAWTAWFVRGEDRRVRETTLDLTDAQWEDWDGAWDLPADWSFDSASARDLATGV